MLYSLIVIRIFLEISQNLSPLWGWVTVSHSELWGQVVVEIFKTGFRFPRLEIGEIETGLKSLDDVVMFFRLGPVNMELWSLLIIVEMSDTLWVNGVVVLTGRTSSKEQYAYVYRMDRVRVVETYQYDDTNDWFERAPYSVVIRPIGISGLCDWCSPTSAGRLTPFWHLCACLQQVLNPLTSNVPYREQMKLMVKRS